MSLNANFNGDRLHLASFLRAVENIPHRPSRFKRREAVTVQSTGPQNNIFHPDMNMFEPADAPLRLDRDEAWLPPDSPLRTPTEITHTEGAIAIGGAFEQKDPYTFQHSANGHCALQKFDTQSMQQALRKGTAVYKSKAKKAHPQPQGDSSTRIRQLPVNGLALVRTSTIDGLPEPSGMDDGSSSPPYTQADPIQDSQAGWPASSVSRYRHVQAPARNARQNLSTRKYIWTSNGGPIKRERGQEFRFIDYPRIYQHQQSNLERVADGFIGSEFTLTSRPKKAFVMPQTRKQNPTPRLKKETELKTQGLVLTTGYLPDQPVHSNVSQFISTPSTSGAAPRYNLSSTPPELEFACTIPPDDRPRFGEFAIFQARVPGEDQLTICGHERSAPSSSAHSTDAQNLNTSITPASSRTTDAEVLNQLSSIRAPVREESSSEENAEESDERTSVVGDEDG